MDHLYLYKADYFPLHQAGFEPAKHEAWHLKCHPFDQTRVLVLMFVVNIFVDVVCAGLEPATKRS